MKILYLKLKNFSSILSGLKRRSIEIDFTKCKNDIVILAGNMGSGKTSILSQLNPFAFTTNDVRGSEKLIIDNTEGYKEIHIKHGPSIYVIKHYYKNKDGKNTIKSFISRDGEELNANGNVTSFKEYVESELHVTNDYMKLMRLGPNVQTFLKMNAKSRKDFSGELLKELDVYNSLFKKVSEDARSIKNVMRSLSDRMKRIGIHDIDTTVYQYNQVVNKLTDNRKSESDMGVKAALVNQEIESIQLENEEMLKSLIETTNDEINTIKQKNESFINILGNDSIDSFILSKTENLSGKELMKQKKELMLETTLEKLKGLYEEIEDSSYVMNDKISYETTKGLYSNLCEKINIKKKQYPKETPFTSEDLKVGLRLLMEIDSISLTIQSFDKKGVKDVADDILNGRSVKDRVNENINRLQSELDTLNRKHLASSVQTDTLYFLTDSHEHQCVYKEFYDDVTNKKGTDTTSVSEKREKLSHAIDSYSMQLDIEKNFGYVLMVIKMNKEIIKRCPPELFSLSHILSRIVKGECVYDEEKITTIIGYAEGYEELQADIKRVNELEDDVKRLEEINERQQKITEKVERNKKTIDEYNNNVVQLNQEIGILKNEVEELQELIEVAKNYKNVDSKLHDLQSIIDVSNDKLEAHYKNMNKRNKLITDLQVLKKDITELHYTIKKMEEVVERNNLAINEYKNLQKEQDDLELEYEDTMIIKETLSSSKGIPLVFIQVYLKKTLNIVNELLGKVYDGDLELEPFVVNDSEFRIPYVKNGITIPDVERCSQGEESWVSLALSFALVKQSLSDYNIMCLDEIDGPLDIESRSKFIEILESLMDDIQAEQVFLITHNAMFDNYPVDVILTTSTAIDNMKNANIIFAA